MIGRGRMPAGLPLLFLKGGVWGLMLVQIDNYFGHKDGMLAFSILGVQLFSGLVFGFYASTHSLRQPRRLDLAFVCGADYAARKAEARRAVWAASWREPGIPLLALAVLGVVKGLGFPTTASVAATFCLESLAVTLVLLTAVHRDWLPISRRKFHGEADAQLASLGGVTASLFLRSTRTAAGFLTGRVPAPYGWLIRRKLLYLFRQDPVLLILYVVIQACLGVQFNIAWSALVTAAFSLVGVMLSLTLIQIGTEDCEEYYRRCAYFLPPRLVDYRGSLALALSVSLAFMVYFALSTVSHQGLAASLGSPGFWQVLVTGTAFPFLMMADGPDSRLSINHRAALNFSYLGIAAILFMFPVWGIASATLVMAGAVFLCLRHARIVGKTPNFGL